MKPEVDKFYWVRFYRDNAAWEVAKRSEARISLKTVGFGLVWRWSTTTVKLIKLDQRPFRLRMIGRWWSE